MASTLPSSSPMSPPPSHPPTSPLTSPPSHPPSSSSSPSPSPTSPPPAPISAPAPSLSSSDRGYLKLLFESFEYILPSSTPSPPSLTLGRKLPMHQPDILPIAADRNISRQHAMLRWVPHDSCWWVECLGKNGMFVGDAFLAYNDKVRMDWEGREAVKMQIGEVIFFVIQPVQQQPSAEQQQPR